MKSVTHQGIIAAIREFKKRKTDKGWKCDAGDPRNYCSMRYRGNEFLSLGMMRDGDVFFYASDESTNWTSSFNTRGISD